MRVLKRINYLQIIEENLSDDDIFNHYFGNFKIGGLYHSPLRKDESPSFSFYINSSNLTRAKDLSLGFVYNGISFVKELLKLSFEETLIKICNDFNLVDEKNEIKVNNVSKNDTVSKTKKTKQKRIIKIQIKNFTEKEINYWKNYGINEETLSFFNVYSTNKIWLDNQPILIKKKELCFSYFFPKTNKVKIYFPERKKGEKFLGNVCNSEDIQGYYQMNIKQNLPEILVLTSSLKEVMFLWENGIYSMVIHGESSYFLPDFIRHLKKYCKTIYSLYDNDKAGKKSSIYLENNYDIKPIVYPIGFCEKDITDEYLKGNKELVKELINNIKSK